MKRWIVLVTATMSLPSVAAWGQEVFPNVQYISGSTALPLKLKGSLVLTASELRFNDKKGESLMLIPLSTIRGVTNSVQGPYAWAADEFLYVDTETTEVAELLVFKCRKKSSQGMMGKIQFQMKQAEGAHMTSAPVNQAAPGHSASRDSAMTSSLPADVPSGLTPGSRVRISAARGGVSLRDESPGRKPQLAGTVISFDGVALVLQPDGETSRPVTYSSSLVERIERSQGWRHSRGEGALIGAGCGAGLAAAAEAIAAFSPNAQSPRPTGGEVTAMIIGTGLVGGIVGSIFYKEEVWTGATIAWRQQSSGIRGELVDTLPTRHVSITLVRFSF